MLRVGLTGGIGSGKSTAAKFFQELGAPVIDADLIAHELIQPGTEQFKKILNHFSKDILDTQNKLNRKKLRKIIFQDDNEKKWLEQCLHPAIIEIMHQRIEGINYPYCILVIPLLAEIPPLDFIDRICVVDIDETIQQQRARQRDQLDIHDLNAIMNAQSTRQKRLALADDVITNNGTLEQLQQQVFQLHQNYLQSELLNL